MVPTKCCYIEVLVEGFSGDNSTKNSISMSFVREKVSRSSDESQETKSLSVVELRKENDPRGRLLPQRPIAAPENHIEEARL